jgi:AbrB family looped-hinge helix DNA binding protein
MLAATLSSKGQVVIPVELRHQLDLHPGDSVVFDTSTDTGTVTLKKRESWDELSARFRSWIKPGTPPLTDVHEAFETRDPRL